MRPINPVSEMIGEEEIFCGDASGLQMILAVIGCCRVLPCMHCSV